MALNWRLFKPLNTWVLIKADPRVKKTAGGIFLPDQLTQVERVMEGTGTLLKVGGRAIELAGFFVRPGDRICYRGFLKDAYSYAFEEEDGCAIFPLDARDILARIGSDVSMGAYSG